MKSKEMQRLVPNRSWREHNGVLIVAAHPDDEVLLGWGLIQMLSRLGIPVTVLLATVGEKGAIRGDRLTDEETIRIRGREFAASTTALGVSRAVLQPHFPDGNLPAHQERLNEAVLGFARRGAFDKIVSFAPNTYPLNFDHADHHAVARAALLASEKADVDGLFTSSRPLRYRPGFLGWTTNLSLGPDYQYYRVPLNKRSVRSRANFLAGFYETQFDPRKKRIWQRFFDRLSFDDKTGKHRQVFFEVRE